MEHIAIMKKSWKLTEKIASGKKKIESRWYKSKRSPWNKIKKEETVYFKDSGEPVAIKAKVEKVLQFSGLTPEKVMEILREFGRDDGINSKDIGKFYEMFKDKKHCILIFLKNSKAIEPFGINKKGFGAMSAWLAVNNINEVKI